MAFEAKIVLTPTISQLRSQCDRCDIGVRSWWSRRCAKSAKSKGVKSVKSVKSKACDPRLWVHRQSRRVRFEVEVERRSRRVLSWRSRRRAILGSGFIGEVEGCDLGAIRSRSWTVKLKGAKSKGSGLWVHGVIWVWSLSLSLRMSLEIVWSENFHFKPFPGQTN